MGMDMMANKKTLFVTLVGRAIPFYAYNIMIGVISIHTGMGESII